jgi:hypothetical protein
MSEPKIISRTIPQDLGDWIAEMTWTEGETQAGPSMLVIRPKDLVNVPAGGLSSTILRQVDFRQGAAKLRESMDVYDSSMELIRKAKKKGPTPMDGVRKALGEGIKDPYLALLAERYVTLVNTGYEKPVDYLADELGRSLPTIKGHLWQARKRGILVGGSAGRKGGHVSEEGIQLVRDWYFKRET